MAQPTNLHLQDLLLPLGHEHSSPSNRGERGEKSSMKAIVEKKLQPWP